MPASLRSAGTLGQLGIPPQTPPAEPPSLLGLATKKFMKLQNVRFANFISFKSVTFWYLMTSVNTNGLKNYYQNRANRHRNVSAESKIKHCKSRKKKASITTTNMGRDQ
jgi:hypothetical protein